MARAELRSLLVIGAGGHGRVVADAALRSGRWARLAASDRDPARCITPLLPGVTMVLPDDVAHWPGEVHVAIGHAPHREAQRLALANMPLATVVHPDATVSPHAELGPGCFVGAQAVVAPRARVDESVIINHGAVVDHDVQIGAYSHVAPRATLGGGVRIGQRVLLGSGAVVLPGKSVGDGITVGAGAVVCNDLIESGVYAGVPARRIK